MRACARSARRASEDLPFRQRALLESLGGKTSAAESGFPWRNVGVTAGHVTVRAAGPSDLDAVVGLRLALLREHGTHPVFGRIRDDAEARARQIFSTQLRNTSTEVIFLAER